MLLLQAKCFTNRCMEHSLHLSAKHFVQAIAPLSPQKIAKKIKSVLQDAEINGEVDFNFLNGEVNGFSFDDGNDNGSEGDGDGDMMEFDVGDSLGKALALVCQVCVYPSLF
jgi:hypothetical protein